MGTSLFAQFEIVMVKGDVYRNGGRDKVKLGEKVARNEVFVYKTDGAAVGIYNAQVGRIVLPEREDNQNIANAQDKELKRDKYKVAIDTCLKTAFYENLFLTNSPKVSLKETSLEKESLFDIIGDAKLYARFENNGNITYTMLSDFQNDLELQIPVGKHEIYKDQSGKPIDLRNVTSHTALVLLCNAGKDNEGKHKVDTVYVKTFNPIYIDDQEGLKKEVRVLINANQATGKNNSDSYLMIKAYITKYYGNINDSDLRAWLADNYNFSK